MDILSELHHFPRYHCQTKWPFHFPKILISHVFKTHTNPNSFSCQTQWYSKARRRITWHTQYSNGYSKQATSLSFHEKHVANYDHWILQTTDTSVSWKQRVITDGAVSRGKWINDTHWLFTTICWWYCAISQVSRITSIAFAQATLLLFEMDHWSQWDKDRLIFQNKQQNCDNF